MNTRRKLKMMFVFSMFSADLIAWFWFIWYIVAGHVPEMSIIKLTGTWTIVLPFPVPRWWDVLIGPVWSCVLIIIFTDEKTQIATKADLRLGLIFGLIFGIVFVASVNQQAGIALALAFALGTGIVFTLAFGQIFAFGIAIGIGLIFALVFGLVIGLIVGLVFTLGVRFTSIF